MRILTGYLLSLLIPFAAIGISSLLKRLLKLKTEISRKLIHILVGNTWFPMYFYLRGTVHFIIVPAIFIAVNWLSNRFNVFKSMEREKKDGKSDLGTVYFAICMTVMSTASYIFPALTIPYGIAVACLTLGDGAAAAFGILINKHNPVIFKGKTLFGSLACIVFSALGVCFMCLCTGTQAAPYAVALLAVLTCVLELFGGRFDNFTVSFGTMAAAYLLLI